MVSVIGGVGCGEVMFGFGEQLHFTVSASDLIHMGQHSWRPTTKLIHRKSNKPWEHAHRFQLSLFVKLGADQRRCFLSK